MARRATSTPPGPGGPSPATDAQERGPRPASAISPPEGRRADPMQRFRIHPPAKATTTEKKTLVAPPTLSA
eukprot:7598083-Heterocapsa_arctica.AAC.1